MAQINLQKVPASYHTYVQLVTEDNLQTAFKNYSQEIISLLKGIPAEKWDYRYAEGKWSIKELIQHVIDAERIFCYRALTFARKDEKVLPGFDENHYAEVSKADRRTPQDLIEELEAVQNSSARLFASFDEEQLQAEGSANNKNIYVEGIGFVIIGHCRHHKKVLLERYL
ncbi:DinB family protein [Chitinophagaceae bacterium LB-8]|jgi:uncharacterized damage-inducible protein DinB|uniref:DinB family protein n=1 Tax=Paraflavisolibacter caeni TaxID=2982496 RepID=A0A9X3BA46_9BACT|nr:DinB family protein [Paraflavisolibacter caeni]MCU7552171.1 DinB family protein [Paraflavisolibacter caeni]